VSGTIMRVGGRRVAISNPGKVLFPDDQITKADLAGYYRAVAPRLLPHLRGRPLALRRFPDGITGEGFFQKQAPQWFPDWIPRVAVPKGDGTLGQVVCEEEAALVYLAGEACIELHPWLATAGDLTRPDRMIFDLDPPGSCSLRVLRETAAALRGLLEGLALTAFVMTSGSRGYHVTVPLAPDLTFTQVHEFARDLARAAAASDPGQRTTELAIGKRGGRVFIDYLRNGYAQTSVAPYSVRARAGAPVALPIGWDQLAATGPRAGRLATVPASLERTGDPWAAFTRAAASPATVHAARDRLLAGHGPAGGG
jgi:bifunctional non-homologous end joining protein LigD